MKKKPPIDSSAYFSNNFPLSTLLIDDILVTYTENTSSLKSNFSKEEAEKFQELLQEAQILPKKAYKKALEWKKESPELDNLLTYLHLQNKQEKKAEASIQNSYEKYPLYFFAKINYADQCLRKKQLEKIPLIFPTFSLKELFPEKPFFHVSEFRGFMLLMGHYHLKLKKQTLAQSYYQKAYLADPTHPSVILLEKALLSQNPLKKLLNKITNKLSIFKKK